MAGGVGVTFQVLPAGEAVTAFLQKTPRIKDREFRQLADEIKRMAFTAADVNRVDALLHLRQSLAAALRRGESFAQWKRNLLAGKNLPLDLAALPRARLQLIFRANVGGALMAGRWRRMVRNAGSHPFWIYDAILDARVRPTHAKLDGRVFAVGDAAAARWMPPNGFNCRCSAIPMTAAEMTRRGLKPVTSGRLARLPKPDSGWAYNPGDGWEDISAQLVGKRLAAQRGAVIDPVRAATLWRRRLAHQGGRTGEAVAAGWRRFVSLTATPHGLAPRGVSARATTAFDAVAARVLDAGVAVVEDTDVKRFWRKLQKAGMSGRDATAWLVDELPTVMARAPDFVGVSDKVIGAVSWVTSDGKLIVYWRWEESWTTKRGFYRQRTQRAMHLFPNFNEDKMPGLGDHFQILWKKIKR